LRRFLQSSFLATTIATTALAATPANAGETKHDLKMVMALAGIPVGKIGISVRLKDDNYTMSGSARTYGISRLFSKAKGFASSSGELHGNHVIALSHSVKYRSDKERGSVDISFSKGNVVRSNSVPAVHYKPGSVKVTADDLHSVLDPMSISIVAVKKSEVENGNAICNRTLPIFDGKNRYNLKMKFKGRRKVVTKGFNGYSYVCSARYVPISGHRPNKKHIRQLAENKSIEISLARIGTTPIYGIIQFSVKTPYGKIIGKPSYFLTTSL